MKKLLYLLLSVVNMCCLNAQTPTNEQDSVASFAKGLLENRQFNEAITYLKHKQSEQNEPDLELVIATHLVTAYMANRQYDLAIHTGKETSYLSNSEQLPLNKRIDYLIALGQANWSGGEMTTAKTLLSKARALSGQTEQRYRMDAITYLQGNVALSGGFYTDAIRHFEDAIAICLDLQGEKHPYLSGLYGNIGIAFSENGRFEDALNYYTRDLALKKKILKENNILFAYTYNNLGNVTKNLGRFEEADDYFRMAANINRFNDGAYSPELARNYLNLGLNFHEQQKLDSAEFYYLRTQAIIEKRRFMDKSLYASLIERQAYLYESRGLFEEAGKRYQETTAYMRQQGLSTLDNQSILFTRLGITALSRKQTDKAISYADSILIMTAGSEEISHFYNPGLAIESMPFNHLDNLCEALLLKGNALLQKYNEAGGTEWLDQANENFITSLEYLALMLTQATEPGDVLYFFQDNLQGIALLALDTSYELFKATGNEKYLQKAVSIIDQSKANAIKAQYFRKSLSEKDIIDKELLGKLRALRNEAFELEFQISQSKANPAKIDSLESRLFNVKNDARSYIDSVKIKHEKYHDMMKRWNEPNIEDIQQSLSENDLFLNYKVSDSAIYIVTINRTHADLLKVKVDHQFQQNIEKLRVSMTEEEVASQPAISMKNYVMAASQLSESLIQPVISKVDAENINRLIISADESLNTVPFSILFTTRPESPKVSSLPFLFKSFSINMQYGGKTKAGSSLPIKKSNSFSFAPRYQNTESFGKVTPLLWNQEEAEVVSGHFRNKVFQYETDMESKFKSVAQNASLIHIAAHAIADDDNPLASHIVLENADYESGDNLLYAYEIYGMNITADLVLLTGCETGSGKLQNGEGIKSLAHSFIFAGAKSTMASLWKVNDKSTLALIDEFAGHLAKGKTKSESLRLAQTAYLEKASIEKTHPFFWAGFVVYGDDAPLSNNSFLANKLNQLLIAGVIIVLLGTVLYFKRG